MALYTLYVATSNKTEPITTLHEKGCIFMNLIKRISFIAILNLAGVVFGAAAETTKGERLSPPPPLYFGDIMPSLDPDSDIAQTPVSSSYLKERNQIMEERIRELKMEVCHQKVTRTPLQFGDIIPCLAPESELAKTEVPLERRFRITKARNLGHEPAELLLEYEPTELELDDCKKQQWIENTARAPQLYYNQRKWTAEQLDAYATFTFPKGGKRPIQFKDMVPEESPLATQEFLNADIICKPGYQIYVLQGLAGETFMTLQTESVPEETSRQNVLKWLRRRGQSAQAQAPAPQTTIRVLNADKEDDLEMYFDKTRWTASQMEVYNGWLKRWEHRRPGYRPPDLPEQQRLCHAHRLHAVFLDWLP